MADGRNSGSGRLPRVLIGSVTRGDTGPVPTITRAFIEGLSARYTFIAHRADRKLGQTRTARLNIVNIFYLIKHFLLWVANLVRYRPDIAHYPVTSFWNFEKSMLFLRCARLCGARTVGHLHGGAFIDFWTRIPTWRKRLSLPELMRLDAFVVLSDGWKERVLTHLPLPAEKVFVVNNPIDSQFERSMLALPVERNSDVILSLGVVGRYKGVLDLIEGAALASKQSGFQLKIVGPEREPGIAEECRTLIAARSLQDRVHLGGGVWGAEKEKLFGEASVFLFPSHIENFPLVILEAAAAGLPIISTPVGAIPEFFHDGESIMFIEPRNAGQIAGAITDLMNNPEKRHALGARAREVFNTRLSRERIMNSLDLVYRHVSRKDGHV